MFLKRINCLLIAALCVISFKTAHSQAGLCPPNMDFEQGSFANWVCRSGTVNTDPTTGLNTVTWTTVGPVPTLHQIITAPGGIDVYGGFSEICPNGSGFSAMLGNATASLNGGIGREASGVSYTYTIPATATVFSILFHYAIVLQNPGHTPEAQPRFRARIRDLTTGTNIPCVTFDFTASSSLPGFRPSLVDPSVLVKDWTPITLNLSALAGRTIELEFIATECTQLGHFGYAYIDVNTTCNGAITGTTLCEGDNSVTLTAPYGFQSYEWYSDNTFTTLLSTAQSLPLSPAPAPGSIFPVIVNPYPGFGCRDTLYGIISAVSPRPVSNAGPDMSICNYRTAQLGAPGLPAHTYEWTPASQVSNPLSPNPIGWNIPPNPTEFVVKTTNILTGCFSYDTVIISSLAVDKTINIDGNDAFCIGETGPILSVSTALANVQWYDNTTPIPGATGFTYQPTVSGIYWAQVNQNGCTDTTLTIPITVHPLPQVSFTLPGDTGCVTKNSFQFTNTSNIVDNTALTYNWKFSDGTTQQVADAVKTFNTVGNYTVQLVATSAFGCKDSSGFTTVYVLPNGVPDFTWDSVCLNRPVTFANLSNENGSAQVNYNWTFNHGGPGSSIKDPPPIIYTTKGRVDVILEMTALGCENDPQTKTKPIQVNAAGSGIRYRTITVPEGSSKFIHVRDSMGSNYLWTPPTQLSSYNTQYTEFFAVGNDVEYLIKITDEHTCVLTDTLKMQILKKPGFYLPSGFTPNGDGLNDVIRPYLVGMKSLKSFSVFNRWGNLVFFSKKYGEAWDGKFKGEFQTTGVFVWILEFYNNDGVLVTEKGTLTLIR